MNSVDVTKGKVLLAEPFMVDTNFKRTAVLLCDHSKKDGTVGFILNRQYKAKVGDLVPELEDFDSPLYLGGPVQRDTLHYIHNVGDLLEESQEVGEGVYWGGNFEKLIFLINNKVIKTENIRFFLGYSGWSAEQLKEEFELGSWVTADLDHNYVFGNRKIGKLWAQIMENKGDTFSVIAQLPDYFAWN